MLEVSTSKSLYEIGQAEVLVQTKAQVLSECRLWMWYSCNESCYAEGKA